jgi:hypothetical protein
MYAPNKKNKKKQIKAKQDKPNIIDKKTIKNNSLQNTTQTFKKTKTGLIEPEKVCHKNLFYYLVIFKCSNKLIV